MTDGQAGGGADELAARSAFELSVLVTALDELARARLHAQHLSRVMAVSLHTWQHPLADALDLAVADDERTMRALHDALDRIIAESRHRAARGRG